MRAKAKKNKFELLTLALGDPDKLEDTYAIQMLLESKKMHFINYNIINVSPSVYGKTPSNKG